MANPSLHQAFIDAATRFPAHTAVIAPGEGSVTYQELFELTQRLSDYLYNKGIRKGDRVGICMRKSIDTVATLYGILKTGAAYVPVDASAPPSRNAYIMHNCQVKVVVTERRFEEKLTDELNRLGANPQMLPIDRVGNGDGLLKAIVDSGEYPPAAENEDCNPGDLAYILYTSGSTGKPKGVSLSHENAVSFVDWCSEIFTPRADDRFSSHAPFHFDLSILDIHVSLKHGAVLVLIAEDIGKDPVRLAPLIAEQRITCWYSAPSILGLLAQFGKLENYDYSALRVILFAGEVFPVKHLRTLSRLLPKARYFNLYGPTETNVCTFYEVPLPIAETRANPFPIGKVCSHLQGIVVDEDGKLLKTGIPGELCISGAGVMTGYWNLPEQTANAFLSINSEKWYKTGDIVVEVEDGVYTYQGRRDRMVKRRGYRVELGEIEAGLYRHPLIKEAAVVAKTDEEAGVRIKAFLSCRQEKKPSIIAMKKFCTENLPLYMIPDEFVWMAMLPKTSTDKIDYQNLKEA